MLAAPILAATATMLGVPEACAYQGGPPAALVGVHGFRDRTGNLRIAIYPANEADFLASGRYVQRMDFPLSGSSEPIVVCAPVPRPGRYVVVALHDRNANGKLDPFQDGVGMSQNPSLGLSKPKVERVEIEIRSVTPMSIVLNYMQGLSVKPWPKR